MLDKNVYEILWKLIELNSISNVKLERLNRIINLLEKIEYNTRRVNDLR